MIYQVIDTETKEEQNFYDASLAQALSWAKDCKRQMRALTGREYEIVVKHRDGKVEPLKEYQQKQEVA